MCIHVCTCVHVYVPPPVLVKSTDTSMGSLHSGKPSSASICICLGRSIIIEGVCIMCAFVHVHVCTCTVCMCVSEYVHVHVCVGSSNRSVSCMIIPKVQGSLYFQHNSCSAHAALQLLHNYNLTWTTSSRGLSIILSSTE